MTATLYVNTSDNGYMNKSITQVGAVNVTLKEDTTLERPVIILENSAQVQQANYVYIDDFGRFYYVEDKTYSHQRMYIQLRVDSLSSFASYIRNCDCVAARSSNKYNMYLDDNQYARLQYNDVYTKPFPNAFSKALNYILLIAG